MPVTDADVVTFALAGCNAAELAEYAHIEYGTAVALLIRARQQIARLPG